MDDHNFMRMKHLAEYGALRFLGGLLVILPRPLAYALGWFIGRLAFSVLRFRRKEAIRRIVDVFGDRYSQREMARIAWISWRNTCFNAVDLMRVKLLTLAQLHRDVRVINAHYKFGAVREFGGCVIAVVHMGNWDLAGIGMQILNFPMFYLARRQKNPYTDAYLNKIREATGGETILTDNISLRRIVKNLHSGLAMAILPDVRGKEDGLQVSFLGKEARIAPGMALFAYLAKVPIVPVILLREGWWKHRWEALPPIHLDHTKERQAECRRATQEVMTIFDRVIRERPEQYFWYNKRWLLD